MKLFLILCKYKGDYIFSKVMLKIYVILYILQVFVFKCSDNVVLKQFSFFVMGYKMFFIDWCYLDWKMNRINVYELSIVYVFFLIQVRI